MPEWQRHCSESKRTPPAPTPSGKASAEPVSVRQCAVRRGVRARLSRPRGAPPICQISQEGCERENGYYAAVSHATHSWRQPRHGRNGGWFHESDSHSFVGHLLKHFFDLQNEWEFLSVNHVEGRDSAVGAVRKLCPCAGSVGAALDENPSLHRHWHALQLAVEVAQTTAQWHRNAGHRGTR